MPLTAGSRPRLFIKLTTLLGRGRRAAFLLALLALGSMLMGGCAMMGGKGLAPQYLNGDTRAHQVGFDRTQLDQAIDLVGQARYDQAMAILAPMYKTLARSEHTEYAAESGFWLGYCQEKQGMIEPARETYQSVIAAYPQTRHADLARRRLDSLTQP